MKRDGRAAWLSGCLRASVAFSFLVFSAGCAPKHIVEERRLDRDAVTHVLARTAAIRNLPLRRDLKVELVEKSFVRALFAAQATAQVPLETARAYERLVKKLGLLPAGFEGERFAETAAAQRVAGFYDPISGSMRIVRRNSNLGTLYTIAERLFQKDLAGEFVLAHELAHALADQHFDLAAYGGGVTNADAMLARRAFAEGDAMLTGFAYVAGRPLRRAAYEAPAGLWPGPVDDLKAIPPVFRRPLFFLYLDGFFFAQKLHEHGGTAALNEAYRRPPRSTEEVLHPEKYLRGDDAPVPVEFTADPEGLRGLPVIDENTLGELGVLALLWVPLGGCGAPAAAAGWGGDRFRLYRLASGDIGFAWQTVWDTPADRDEFVENLALALAKTFGVEAAAAAGSRTLRTREGTFTITRSEPAGALVVLKD